MSSSNRTHGSFLDTILCYSLTDDQHMFTRLPMSRDNPQLRLAKQTGAQRMATRLISNFLEEKAKGAHLMAVRLIEETMQMKRR